MGSRTFSGVRFAIYSDDHPPAHVHGFYAGVRVIVTLEGDIVGVAGRSDSIAPANAKRSDIAHIVKTARQHAQDLLNLWRRTHG